MILPFLRSLKPRIFWSCLYVLSVRPRESSNWSILLRRETSHDPVCPFVVGRLLGLSVIISLNDVKFHFQASIVETCQSLLYLDTVLIFHKYHLQRFSIDVNSPKLAILTLCILNNLSIHFRRKVYQYIF